jgi:hypothetical protein
MQHGMRTVSLTDSRHGKLHKPHAAGWHCNTDVAEGAGGWGCLTWQWCRLVLFWGDTPQAVLKFDC